MPKKLLPLLVISALKQLEAVLFPHQESEEEQESFTEVGRRRAGDFLAVMDENAFYDGFNAAIEALRDRGVVHPSTNVAHPQFVKDRRKEYLKARF